MNSINQIQIERVTNVPGEPPVPCMYGDWRCTNNAEFYIETFFYCEECAKKVLNALGINKDILHRV